MANNRMFLVNKLTGKKLSLVKCFQDPWYVAPNDLHKEAEEFFRDPAVQASFYENKFAWEIEFDHPEGQEIDI